MTKKTVIIFSCILILLLVFYYASKLFSNRMPEAAFEKMNITELEITEKEKEPVTLKKTGETWFEGKWPADPDKINRAMEAINAIKLGDVISRKPEKYYEFEVSTAAALSLRINNNQEIYIGKRGSDWSSSFVRVKDNPSVYIIRGINKSIFTGDNKSWREKDIIAYEKTEIEDIDIEYDGNKYTVKKGTQTWTDMVHELKYLNASEFLEDDLFLEKEYEKPYLKISLNLSGDMKHDYSIIQKDRKYYIKSEKGGLSYEIGQDRINKITEFIIKKMKHEKK